jgi:hypothetical protein
MQDEKAGTWLLLESHSADDRIKTAHHPLYLEVPGLIRRKRF